VRRSIPQDSHSAFIRALLYAAGGAILGLILYAAFGIITGWMIGYVSLAVGYIVGKAMKMGSGGIGGRRYQIAAVVLTYAAVSMAAIPIYISQAAKQQHKAARPAPTATVEAPAEQGATNVSPAPGQAPTSPKRPANLAAALIGLALIGLASPFLELADPLHGMIGLVILFVGIQIAWKMAAGTSLAILGPFKVPTRAAGPTAAG
jgi:predicted outer membrane lipoprotein